MNGYCQDFLLTVHPNHSVVFSGKEQELQSPVVTDASAMTEPEMEELRGTNLDERKETN